MGRGGCVNGELDTTLYASPVPLIGLYIAGATLVCFFCMTFDLVHAFNWKKPFLPCKLFPLNSFTLTVLAVATKIPLDLTTSMPRAEDQLSKLTGTALLCTSLGFYMPSLGTMGTSERFGNMAALSVTVITMVVNVCIQMGTGVIYAFTVEHIVIMVCTLLLLLFMWSSAIAFRGQREGWRPWARHFRSKTYREIAEKGVEGLRKLLVKVHVMNYTGNPQTLLCETAHHHVFGLLCSLSSAVVMEAMLRSFALKNMSKTYCSDSGVSDYGWSIPIMIVVQLLTIAVGTFSIIYRWLSFFNHTDKDDVGPIYFFNPGRELEYLKLKTLPFWLLSNRGKLFNVFLTAKNFIMDVLMGIQIVLFGCSVSFVGIPMYSVKRILKFIIFDPFYRIFFHDMHTDDVDKYDIQKMLEEMSISDMSAEIVDFALSCVYEDTFEKWIVKMGMEDMLRWRNTHKRDSPTQLIQLISNKCLASASASASTSKSECFPFIRKLEVIGKEFVDRERASYYYEYRVSCVSVLVLSGMFAELMPSPSSCSSCSSRESVLQILNESFEMIYYMDQRTTDTPNMRDKTRWTAAKDVWGQWENPHHWFRTKIISHAFKKESKEYSELDQLHHVHRYAYDTMEQIWRIKDTMASKHEALVRTEIAIICEFILQEQKKHESTTGLLDFIEKCFAEMLYFFLSGLPRAILKEVDVDGPTEIGEERVKKAFKFFCKLEQLDKTIEWSWPAEKFEPESQANDIVHCNSSLVVAAPDCIYSEVEAPNISNAVVVDRKVGNSDVSLAVVAATCAAEEDEEDDDDDDETKEIGSDEIV